MHLNKALSALTTAVTLISFIPASTSFRMGLAYNPDVKTGTDGPAAGNKLHRMRRDLAQAASTIDVDLERRRMGLAGATMNADSSSSTSGRQAIAKANPNVDPSNLKEKEKRGRGPAARRLSHKGRRSHSKRSPGHLHGEVVGQRFRKRGDGFYDSAHSANLKSVRAVMEQDGQQRDLPVHALVSLQQQLNRAERRHAMIRGYQVPSEDDFALRMVKRMESVGINTEEIRLRKRDGSLLGVEKRAGKQGSGATGSTSAASAGSAAGGGAAGFSQTELKALTQNTVSKAQTPTAANTLGMDIESADVGYFATVQMGTPAKNFNILMDSGSADLWVPSTSCTTCGNHQSLGSKTSSSFNAGNATAFQVTYGTGQVSGAIIQDDINIAGLQLKAHSFGVTTQESKEFSSNQIPFDGLMGLAQGKLSNQKVPTPIESLGAAKAVAAVQVGFHLARVADGTNDGTITFGGVDSSKFTGSLTTFPNVNKNGFWEGDMAAVTVDEKSTGLTGRTAILDTGTTLIVAPPADVTAVHKLITGSKSDGQGGFTIPCTTSQSVALSFGGQSFAIDSRDLTVQPVDPNNLQGDCVSGISAGQIGGPNEWLVGDVFLKNVYFAIDTDTNTIGLATINKAAGSAAAPAAATSAAGNSTSPAANATATA